MSRIDIDHYFLKIASVVAERSTCTRHHVGVAAVRDKFLLATGYNGAVSGQLDCLELGCRRLGLPSGIQVERCRAVHAEMNVLAQSATHGSSLVGATLYSTHAPCIPCAKVLINAKISRFVYFVAYKDKSGEGVDGIAMLRQSEIVVDCLDAPKTSITVLE